MPGTMAGFPYWEVRFDAAGQLENRSAAERLVAEVREGPSDLFVFTHGWNNDAATARGLYERFFHELRGVLDRNAVDSDAAVGALGVFWPSMRWPDEAGEQLGGAAALSRAGTPLLVLDLKAVYTDPQQLRALDELAELLERQPESVSALHEFQQLMAVVAGAPDAFTTEEDSGERGLLTRDPETVFGLFADELEREHGPADEGGAAGLADGFKRLWAGAKEALRQATYWEMKKRAGVVGQQGLGPLVQRLGAQAEGVRVHLIGHSFGARLVSFALAGLPQSEPDGSPVKSMLLLQGAFSHFSFASSLPHAPGRGGALAGLNARVDGPLLASFSIHDSAVGRFYPLASMLAGDDSADANDALYRWGAIGHDGAQNVDAMPVPLGPVGSTYPFVSRAWLNLDAGNVIRNGSGPSGAHSDIIHPEVAWVALTAAGIAVKGDSA